MGKQRKSGREHEVSSNAKWIIIGAVIVGVLLVILPLALRSRETYRISGPGGTATITIDRAKRQTPPQEKTLVEIPFGERGQLATMWIQVTGSTEAQVLTSNNQFVNDAYATTGTKFVVLTSVLCNTTNEPITIWNHEWKLQDGSERVYNTYQGRISMDGHSAMHSLQPSIPITCKIVFEVPMNSIDYGLVMGKAGTNEFYRFNTSQ